MRFFRSVHRVEPARHDDTAALARLYDRAWHAQEDAISPLLLADQAVPEEEVSAWMHGGFELYRTAHDGRLVGAMRLSFPNGVCHVDRLAVDPELWRRGHGRALLDTAIVRARRMGVLRLWAQASANLEAACGLYHQLGFHEQGRLRPRYWKEPIILFERGV
ncbi:MAG: GNAT family N-acetyltransferase [Candidatus Dormibacteraeota bacterium]|nr:GNAT family N-acetyltransferase [Candidatus Dormibacteraeota bacterium]